jgi:lysozyme family protein
MAVMSTTATRPPRSAVVACALGAVGSMAAGVYFGGHDQLPLAMVGASLFVALGGVAFELARRRSR